VYERNIEEKQGTIAMQEEDVKDGAKELEKSKEQKRELEKLFCSLQI
jgi:hypothetical protein